MEFEPDQDWQGRDYAPHRVQVFFAWLMIWFGIRQKQARSYTPAASRHLPRPPRGRYERLMWARRWIPFYHLGAYWFLKQPGQTRGQLNERVLAVSPHGRIAVYRMRRQARRIKGRAPWQMHSGCHGSNPWGREAHTGAGLWDAHFPLRTINIAKQTAPIQRSGRT